VWHWHHIPEANGWHGNHCAVEGWIELLEVFEADCAIIGYLKDAQIVGHN
jgi:hypothetical protein